MLLKFLNLIAFAICVQCQLDATETYTRSVTLNSGNVILYWKFTETHITFEVHGKTEGWVGIGFSPNGAMTGADIFVGWVKDGDVVVTDRHGTANTFPPKDPKQDIDVLAGKECEGWTMFKFSRQLAACESEYDRDITTNTQRLIWAYGESDPTGNDILAEDYHTSNRGVKSMYFLEPSDRPNGDLPVGPEYNSFDIVADNFQVPAVATYYNCRLFELSQFTEKNHIVKVEPIIQEENLKHVHHMVIYTCTGNLNATEIGVDKICSDGILRSFDTCVAIILAWAIGGGPIVYPDNAGYAIGSSGDPLVMMLEIHYDNPDAVADIIDSSGMRFIYTNTLRQHDAGVLQVGNLVSGALHFIPPGAQSYTSSGYCAPDCLERYIEDVGTELTVFNIMLHSHLAGRSIKLRHFRNGEELPYIAHDETYDFDYQETRHVSPEVKVKPGDVLRVDCVYNTEGQTEMLQGGEGTNEEMCMVFITYYPKINLSYCQNAAIPQQSYGYFGIQGYDQSILLGRLEDVTVTAPASLVGKTVKEVMEEYNWTETNIDKFSVEYLEMNQYQLCFSDSNTASEVSADVFTIGTFPNITSEYSLPEKSCTQPSTGNTLVPATVPCGTPLAATYNLILLMIAAFVVDCFQYD